LAEKSEMKNSAGISKGTNCSPRRYRLILEYDGTNFSGWQKQTDARTVQGDLLKAASQLFDGKVLDVQGCGRTDTGVHALEYVAHLEVTSDISPAELEQRFNTVLPKDIAVKKVLPAGPRFHARHSCLARSYLYILRDRKSAFGKRYSWWIQEKLELDRMRQAGQLFEGMHDFVAFAEAKELKKSTQVLVHQVKIFNDDDVYRIRVVGSHFLWHMVRRMVGVLVDVGCRRMLPQEIPQLFQNQAELPRLVTAPAVGLFFERAFYDQDQLMAFLDEGVQEL
jgi:tRNA pseudouridine38-40 synthase